MGQNGKGSERMEKKRMEKNGKEWEEMGRNGKTKTSAKSSAKLRETPSQASGWRRLSCWPRATSQPHSPRRNSRARAGHFPAVRYLTLRVSDSDMHSLCIPEKTQVGAGKYQEKDNSTIPQFLFDRIETGKISECLSRNFRSSAKARTTLMPSFTKPSTKLSTAMLDPLVAKIPDL